MYYARFLVFPATKMTDFSLTRVYENPAILNCSATTTTTIYRDIHSIAFHFFIPFRQHNSTIDEEKNSQTHVHTFAFSNLIIRVRSHTQTFGARICVQYKRQYIIILCADRYRKTIRNNIVILSSS